MDTNLRLTFLPCCICILVALTVFEVIGAPSKKPAEDELSPDEIAKMPEVRGEIVNDTDGGAKRIIMWGTKWCGHGNKAENIDDLGTNAYVDACCRDHDNCPLIIRKDHQRWGVKNNQGYTIMDCKCDLKFYKCMKTLKKQGAGVWERFLGFSVGQLFFNGLGTPCVKIPKNVDKDEPMIGNDEKRANPKAPKAKLMPAKTFK